MHLENVYIIVQNVSFNLYSTSFFGDWAEESTATWWRAPFTILWMTKWLRSIASEDPSAWELRRDLLKIWDSCPL